MDCLQKPSTRPRSRRTSGTYLMDWMSNTTVIARSNHATTCGYPYVRGRGSQIWTARSSFRLEYSRFLFRNSATHIPYTESGASGVRARVLGLRIGDVHQLMSIAMSAYTVRGLLLPSNLLLSLGGGWLGLRHTRRERIDRSLSDRICPSGAWSGVRRILRIRMGGAGVP